jgi:hypothetical protein
MQDQSEPEGGLSQFSCPLGRSLSTIFEPSGHSLITCGGRGLKRWSIPPTALQDGPIQLGPPTSLTGRLTEFTSRASLSADGRLVAVVSGNQEIKVLRLDKPADPVLLGPHWNAASVAMSPDGKWVCSGTWGALERRFGILKAAD